MNKQCLTQLNLGGVLHGTYSTQWIKSDGAILDSYSPIDGSKIGQIETTNTAGYESAIQASQECFIKWRSLPAPKRGDVIREIGDELRKNKDLLGQLITLEMGKIISEGLGEVQEAIDIADFAVGLSRQLCGQTMHSERPEHRMYEQWHPLGPIGVITAFNFPIAVWAWNAMLAAVCGDTIIWKPSEHTPLCAVATHQICSHVATKKGFPALFTLMIGDGPELGKQLASDKRIPLISATGSCRMGKSVAETVASRFGKTILELGGNNAVIVLKDADLKLALPSICFGSVGTAGQRCTSTRRVLMQKEIAPTLIKKLKDAYSQVKIGDPFTAETLMGPLINESAVKNYERALKLIKEQGGEIVSGGEILTGMASKLYVKPTIVLAKHNMPIVFEETFAPILYLIEIDNLEEAIKLNNSVSQGLSSSIFTTNLQSAEKFLSYSGSDCGIANVNIGTSGAEIGGAFGGEKETGGGRESGSDSWRQYMRRQTNTINYSDALPLAQGVKFDLG